MSRGHKDAVTCVAASMLAVGLVLLAQACAKPSKEAAIQSGLNAGMLACDLLLADPTIPRDPTAQAFCERLQRGCHE